MGKPLRLVSGDPDHLLVEIEAGDQPFRLVSRSPGGDIAGRLAVSSAHVEKARGHAEEGPQMKSEGSRPTEQSVDLGHLPKRRRQLGGFLVHLVQKLGRVQSRAHDDPYRTDESKSPAATPDRRLRLN